MFYDILAIVALLAVFTALMWLSTLLTFPVTQKRALDRTSAGDSLLQFSIFPALMFMFALATGFAHQCLVGPGCLDVSQPIVVAPNSHASDLGLKSGDTLVRFNGATTDCFGDLRLLENSTSATLIVKRSIANGGGQLSLPLTARDSLQNLFRNGLSLPILRHPLSWRGADFRSRDYFSTVGYALLSSFSSKQSAHKPVSYLHLDASSIDLFVVCIFALAFFSYLVPIYFALRVVLAWLKSAHINAALLSAAGLTSLPVEIARNTPVKSLKTKGD